MFSVVCRPRLPKQAPVSSARRTQSGARRSRALVRFCASALAIVLLVELGVLPDVYTTLAAAIHHLLPS